MSFCQTGKCGIIIFISNNIIIISYWFRSKKNLIRIHIITITRNPFQNNVIRTFSNYMKICWSYRNFFIIHLIHIWKNFSKSINPGRIIFKTFIKPMFHIPGLRNYVPTVKPVIIINNLRIYIGQLIHFNMEKRFPVIILTKTRLSILHLSIRTIARQIHIIVYSKCCIFIRISKIIFAVMNSIIFIQKYRSMYSH